MMKNSTKRAALSLVLLSTSLWTTDAMADRESDILSQGSLTGSFVGVSQESFTGQLDSMESITETLRVKEFGVVNFESDVKRGGDMSFSLTALTDHLEEIADSSGSFSLSSLAVTIEDAPKKSWFSSAVAQFAEKALEGGRNLVKGFVKGIAPKLSAGAKIVGKELKRKAWEVTPESLKSTIVREQAVITKLQGQGYGNGYIAARTAAQPFRNFGNYVFSSDAQYKAGSFWSKFNLHNATADLRDLAVSLSNVAWNYRASTPIPNVFVGAGAVVCGIAAVATWITGHGGDLLSCCGAGLLGTKDDSLPQTVPTSSALVTV